MKCQHPKTATLYAQRRIAGTRSFVAEAKKCDSCGSLWSLLEPRNNKGEPQ